MFHAWFEFFEFLGWVVKTWNENFELGPMEIKNISTDEDFEKNEYRFLIEQPILKRRR